MRYILRNETDDQRTVKPREQRTKYQRTEDREQENRAMRTKTDAERRV
jgi:hypothetical protein